ncbi:hypothetical protein IFM89_000206 [Coptis chinensis]|uniref:Uncharacterized protein n=1 Tax=Coptis chinensis TaxID=261450 RepID=A0A835LY10_9MAGN|nr:hypothetical protein IFM89_000206 [Coptis chinensis]
MSFPFGSCTLLIKHSIFPCTGNFIAANWHVGGFCLKDFHVLICRLVLRGSKVMKVVTNTVPDSTLITGLVLTLDTIVAQKLFKKLK